MLTDPTVRQEVLIPRRHASAALATFVGAVGRPVLAVVVLASAQKMLGLPSKAPFLAHEP